MTNAVFVFPNVTFSLYARILLIESLNPQQAYSSANNRRAMSLSATAVKRRTMRASLTR